MKLRFTRRAAEDLLQIADYIREHDAHAALGVRAAILESLRILTDFPLIGRRQTIEGVRKLTTRRYPYAVYYLIDERTDEVVVLAVLHPAQARPYDDR